MSRIFGRWSWLLCLLAVLLLSACGGEAHQAQGMTNLSSQKLLQLTAHPTNLEVSRTDAASGLLEIELDNETELNYQVQFIQLKDVTFEVFKSDLLGDNPWDAIYNEGYVKGGVASLAPTKQQGAILNLPAGVYAIVGLTRNLLGKLQIVEVGIQPLYVGDNKSGLTQVASDLQVTLNENDVTIAPAITSGGLRTVKVNNNSSRRQEFQIIKVLPGFKGDITSLLQKPSYQGGMAALMPGETGFVELNLPAGRYAAVSWFPDNKGKYNSLHLPHFFSVK